MEGKAQGRASSGVPHPPPQKTCSYMAGGRKDKCKTKNSTNCRGTGTHVVTCGVIWEEIMRVRGRCCACAHAEQERRLTGRTSGSIMTAMTTTDEGGERAICLAPHGMPFAVLESAVEDVLGADSDITDSSGLMKNGTS